MFHSNKGENMLKDKSLSEQSEAKPFPFCGGKDILISLEHHLNENINVYHPSIYCYNCTASIPLQGIIFDPKIPLLKVPEINKTLLSIWNKRA